jgi:aspartyl-tRNA(Asn)/glutamyl-tRNA(Gln) amidotransferase subunit A
MSDARASGLLELGIREIGAGLRRGDHSPLDVTRAALARIEATEISINAWVLVDETSALAAAAHAETELLAGDDRGPLHGIPVGVKDIFDVAGWPTRCGSASRADALPARADAWAVSKLRQAGAIFLGKTVTQEFAAGVISAPARNPWDPDRVPGGSSGGSAAAVAVGACLAALGSDTGGSIRIPAAACGVCGFKPLFGQLDVTGVYPLSWSLDTIGPIARTVDDTWLAWRALVAVPERTVELDDLRDVRVGLPRTFFLDWVQPEIAMATETAVTLLEQRGATVIETPWLEAAAARALAFIINRVETAAVHERVALDEPERFAGYGTELRLRIAAGREIPATAYVAALRARETVRDAMASLFAMHQLDALLTPALPTTAVLASSPTIEETGREESIGAAWTRLTMPFNATGQPVLSLPCALDRRNLPIGMQLAGSPGTEQKLFRIGAALEEAVGWRTVRPPLLTLPNGAPERVPR